LRHGGQAELCHGLGSGAEHGQLLQHEAHAGVLGDELFERRHVGAAVGAIMVEKGDDAHLAVRISGDEGLRRAVDGIGMGADGSLDLCSLNPAPGNRPKPAKRQGGNNHKEKHKPEGAAQRMDAAD
jgi:hypothetical protein